MTASRLVAGSGSQGVQVLSSLGTSIQVLHGNAAGLPTWGALNLTTDTSGTLPVASGGTNLTTATDDNIMVGNGTTWQSKQIPNCTDTGGQHLNYDTATNSVTCGTSGGGGGGGSTAFSAITTATNTTAVMTVGTGAQLVPSGTGVVQATQATNPRITSGLLDVNGNPMIAFSATASAVDGFTFTNAATASPATVQIAATGSDSNINFGLVPKGTGSVILGDCTTNCLTEDTSAITGAKTHTRQNLTGTLALTSLAGGGTGATSFTASRCVQVNAGGTALESSSGGCGGGSVSSVAQTFTGGLISVAGSPITTSGTLALTVAGTSGGIPYFSSGTTWASSAALTANLPVIGGGAGVAPTVGTRSGNTTAFVTTTGSLTSGRCVEIDANGNFIQAAAACGTGSGGGLPITFRPQQNEPPAANFASLDTRNGHVVLDFDGTTDEEAVFSSVLPASYAGTGLTVDTWWSFTSATSGSLRVQAAFERIDVSSLDIDADSFAAFQSAGGTAPGTSGQVIKVSVTFTDGAQMDSLAAGEAFRLKIRRDADGTSGTDDITTDAELLKVLVRAS
jgi:hypothetical protein